MLLYRIGSEKTVLGVMSSEKERDSPPTHRCSPLPAIDIK